MLLKRRLQAKIANTGYRKAGEAAAVMIHKRGPLTEQPEVIAQIYGIDPSRTSRFRMAMYGAEILEEIVDDGYPLDRMRELRNLANPDSESTRLFDRLERDDPLMGLAV